MIFPKDRVNIHKNARLTPSGRERIVRQIGSGQTPEAATRAAGVCQRTTRKLVDRYRPKGLTGPQDRPSRPHRLYRTTPQAIVDGVELLRRQRFTGKQIAAELGISPSTLSRILKCLGLSKIAALEPAAPVRRYEREKPGEMIHIDIKKLGLFNRVGHRITGDRTGQSNSRGVGWEFVHVAIDDHSRVAFAKIMASEKKRCATAFLRAAIAYYASLGFEVGQRVSDRHSRAQSDIEAHQVSYILMHANLQTNHFTNQYLFYKSNDRHPIGARRVPIRAAR